MKERATRKRRAAFLAIALLLTGYLLSWSFAATLGLVHPMANLRYFYYGDAPGTRTDKLLSVLYYPLYEIEQAKGGSRFGIHWSRRSAPTLPGSGGSKETGMRDGESGKDLFGAIPVDERNDLLDRLSTLVRFEQDRQWEKMYDLLYDQKESLRDFVARKRTIRARLLSFESTEVFYVQREGAWGIIGCAETVTPEGKHELMEMATDAKIKEGSWYFSGLGIVIHHDHKDSCRE